MAFAGLKKQINKANQFMNEKIGGVEGTKLDEEFVEMERKTDIMFELVEELQLKTKEFLHPNPASRAKMSAVKGISKLSGQAKAATYPQPEGVLGDAMTSYGKKIGEDSNYALSLIETGESMKQIADIKYNLDDNMKMNFLEPLHNLSTKDLKEVMHHRKKLQGRRLDYDCKKRKKEKDEDIKLAEDKFAESLHLAQVTMNYLLDNDTEGISQLATFAENLLDYHRQCTEILETLAGVLHDKKNESANMPKIEFVPKTLADLGVLDAVNGGVPHISSAVTPQRSPYGSPTRSPAHTPTQSVSPLPSPVKNAARSPMNTAPCCQALYDFEAENPGELGFGEGDTVNLTQRIDENWFEGTFKGKSGLFPVSYVEVVNPLPDK